MTYNKFFCIFAIVLTLVLNTQGGIVQVDFSFSPMTVNSNSKYSFVLYLSSQILSSDSIKITFPSQLTLQAGTRSCFASCDTDSTLRINNCSAQSNILTATIISTSTSQINYALKLQVLDGITNPPSIYSDNISVYIYDKNGVVKENNDAIKAKYIPETLKVVTMTSSSNISGALSSLTFSFTPGQPILKNGQIQVTLPCFNQNSGSPSCTTLLSNMPEPLLKVNSGINVNSTITITDKSITLKNIFPISNSDTITEISFTIQNIYNPPSTAVLSGYVVSTLDSLRNSIEVSNSLSLQMSQPSSEITFSVNSSNKVINQISTLSFYFTTGQFKPSGAILELIFPDDLPIFSVNFLFTGISKITQSLIYSITGQTVKITNAIGQYYESTDIHYFKASSIINPSSTKPTGNFKFNIYTPDNNLMYSLASAVNYSATPGQFSNVSVLQSSNEVNALSTYTFSFFNTDPILMNSYLKITFPVEIQIKNFSQSSCNGIISGLSSSSLCEVISNSILKITNGFPITLVENSKISFSISNVTNNFCAKRSSSFQIESFTSSNYLIDVVTDSVNVSFVEGNLINSSIITGSKTNYETTSYQVIFTNKNNLPINSKIILEFPSGNDVLITDSNKFISNCSIKIGIINYNINICSLSLLNDTQIVTLSNFNSSQNVQANTNIIMTLPYIRNPRSFKESKTFKITTQTSEGCNIDKNYENLTIKNNISGSSTNISVTSSSLITGDTSNYEFSITPGTMLISGDVLKIIFPTQITGLNNNNISIVGTLNLSVNPQNTITQDSQGIFTVTIVLSFNKPCNCVTSSEKFIFQIQNLKNPISLKPTDSFNFSFSTTDSFEIEKYVKTLQISMTTPNQLQESYVKGTSNQKNFTTDYTFRFTPNNIIPKGGFIIIVYPSQISVIDGSCTSVLSLPQSITCIIDTSKQEIKLSGGFNSDFMPSQIQFIIKGLKNNMPENLSMTDSFKIFTKTSEEFIIDQKVNGLNIIFNCQSNCATCTGDQNICLTCLENSFYPFLQEGKCLTQCSTGYSSNGSTNKCVECNSKCSTCTQDSKDKCLSCRDPMLYLLADKYDCVATCPDGFYPDLASKRCTACVAPCKTCSSNSQCSSCLSQSPNNNFYLFYPLQKICLAACPSGVTVLSKNTNTCLDCENSCMTCENDINNCTSCREGSFLYNNKCIDLKSCPLNHYTDSSKRLCVPCDSNCLQCGNSYETCKLCNNGYILNNQLRCVKATDICARGYFLNSRTSICEPCTLPCLTCEVQTDFCTSCSQALLIEKNKCVEKCSEGFFMRLDTSNNYVCQQCDNLCKTCNESAYKCLSCNDNSFQFELTCVSKCPANFYDVKGKCEKCSMSNCDTCENDNCLNCAKGFFLLQGKCYTSCPKGYKSDDESYSCIIQISQTYLPFVPEYKFSKTKLIFFIFSLMIVLISYILKHVYRQTYFYATCISLISIVKVFHNFIYIYYAFVTGINLFFVGIAYILIMTVLLNCIFIFVYDFHISKDKQFKYWQSTHKISSSIFFIITLIIDYKFIRLFYSRLCMIDFFNAKFLNYNRIHNPIRKFLIVDIMTVNIPISIFSIIILSRSRSFSDIWWIALENILIYILLTLLEIIDLCVNTDLNTDFYNQKINYPEITPYDYMYAIKNNKYKIEKKFDFDIMQTQSKISRDREISQDPNIRNKKYVKFSSIISDDRSDKSLIIQNMIQNTGINNMRESKNFDKINESFTTNRISRNRSFESNKLEKDVSFKKQESLISRVFKDDSKIDLKNNNKEYIHPKINSAHSKKPTAIDKFSSGMKNFMKRFSISPNTKRYEKILEGGEIKVFIPEINTPNFNDIEKSERSHLPLNLYK